MVPQLDFCRDQNRRTIRRRFFFPPRISSIGEDHNNQPNDLTHRHRVSLYENHVKIHMPTLFNGYYYFVVVAFSLLILNALAPGAVSFKFSIFFHFGFVFLVIASQQFFELFLTRTLFPFNISFFFRF